jgi:hypothetical protein
VGKMINSYKIFVGNSRRKRPLEYLGVDGKIMLDIRETG